MDPHEPRQIVRTSAMESAAQLPRPPRSSGGSARDQTFWAVVGVAAFAVITTGGLLFFLTFEWGWLMLIIGLATWLLMRFVYFRMPGSETGRVAVDPSGSVHLATGRLSVRRSRSWRTETWP